MKSVFSQEEKVNILRDIININTVNDNEIEVAQYLQRLFEQYHIESHIDQINDTRANLIATIGSGHPVLGISGHMDVVSEGDKQDWSVDPFEMTEKDGNLYGRGTSDMKSGLAALAIALIDIKENNLLQQGTIKFMATAGEEMEQLGSEQLYDKGYMDDVDALVIAEPSEQTLVYAHKGSMDFRITSKGRASHSSIPVMGQNAIKPLLDFIQNIDKSYQEIAQATEFKELDFTRMLETVKDRLPESLDEEEVKRVVSGLVINNTIIQGGNQVNSIPDRAQTEFNIRTVPEYNNEQVKSLFNNHLEKINQQGGQLEQDIYLDLEPVLTTGDNRLISTGYDLATSLFDHDIIITPTVGVTDASNLLKGKDEDFPFLMLGPGTKPHQVDEFVSKDKYLDFITYYIQLFTTYLNEH
ncbi:ArgE/DapE family deacylase [Staphylococcus epidermidis]|uniref:ArgE/DapE family deacylase n=2 Tax=Staphylococcus TaxID=1279 RepID=UPI00024E1CC8|nr:ArgE/DapE family deacylase [Staphylococcus epidermidis]EHR81057.1 succinyl-diaminopimelate desuccinylase [Staphylococcus epidermidis VCU118]